ncbi:uncharacterized protein LOC117120035 [Anneissia japonica]|uniref:uncharacterized protein LOC117120035 n=1 Tax=Anneissia japonica TaxID=1529436 RepID=UPI0014254B70|nr:uncharacterized protein LOC117120035 [Anneissia japonica]
MRGQLTVLLQLLSFKLMEITANGRSRRMWTLQFQLPEAVRPLPPTLRKKRRVKTVGLSHNKMGVGLSTNHLMKYEIRKKIVDNLANKSSVPTDITCIWDYAGQMIYYITHRVFLTDGSSYGVVFSLLDNLEEFAKPRDIYKGHFEMTNLQMIIFWIRSIYEHTLGGLR